MTQVKKKLVRMKLGFMDKNDMDGNTYSMTPEPMSTKLDYALERYRYWLTKHKSTSLAARLANREAEVTLKVVEYRRLNQEKRSDDHKR